jgi:hypothetical protein
VFTRLCLPLPRVNIRYPAAADPPSGGEECEEMLRRYGPGELQWMESNGGPLLLVPGEHRLAWEGIEPPRDGPPIEARFRWNGPDEPATDYDRACNVKGYVGQIEIGAGYGLVLGDYPTGTAWLAFHNTEDDGDAVGGILIRWMHANSEADVLSAIQHVPDELWHDDGLTLEVGSQPLYLFDSAFAGDDLAGDDHLLIHLPTGEYAIATAEYEPDRDTAVVLHRLQRTGGAQT